MSSLPVLEVALGLSFVYLLLALIVTTVTEWIARIRSRRGQMLEDGIRRMLGDENGESGISKEVLNHPLIKSMAKSGKTPSYVPSKIFASALTDVLKEGRIRPQASLAAEAGTRPSAAVPRALERSFAALSRSAGKPQDPSDAALPDIDTLERWFDQHMERVSGWYKRHTQTVVLIASVALTLVANADSLGLATRLWSDSALRSTIIDTAKARIAMGPPLETVEYTDPTTPKPTSPVAGSESKAGLDQGGANRPSAAELALLGNMMGWRGERERLLKDPFKWFLQHLVGWLITALAVSLGAPFWFDTLNRFINIRSAGPPPKSVESTRG